MNKILIAVAVVGTTLGVFAGPRGCGGRGHHTPPPRQCCRGGGDFWGKGGRNFWPGFVGGLIGGVVANAAAERETVVVQQTPTVVTQPIIIQQPTVVQQPVVVQPATVPATQVQNVWVEGCYVDQVQANGTTVRTWNPGHYEQRMVTM